MRKRLVKHHPVLVASALIASLAVISAFHITAGAPGDIWFAAAVCISIVLTLLLGWFLKDRQELVRVRRELDLILNNTALRILFKDARNRILRLNPPAANFHGLSVEEMTGKSGYEIFPKYAKQRHEEDLAVIRSGKPHLGEVKEMGARNGVTLWGRADKIPYKDPISDEDRILMVATDVTDQVNAEIAVKHSEERYHLAIEMSSIGTWDWDMQTGARYWSPRMKEIVGLPRDVVAHDRIEFDRRIHPEDLDRVRAARKAHLEHGVPYLIEFRLRHERGDYVWVRARGQAVWDEDGNPVRMAGSVEDISDRVDLREKLAHLAHHDGLTGLLNRVAFREHLVEALDRAKRGETFALVCIDLDGFKCVNDTFGHAAGDKLLKMVGKRLRACAGRSDRVARLGGDEFAILHVSSDVRRTAGAIAERLVETIRAPYQVDGAQVAVGVSIGIAVAPEHGTDADQLTGRADLALYCAKHEGRGKFCYFDAGMESQVMERHALGIDLRRALSDRKLAVVYQPLVKVETSEITGFEALARWNHPVRGEVPPAKFIPVAEECGLINQLGEWVLTEACREAAKWPDPVKVAVNVSPHQFRGGMLMLAVTQALAKSRLHPGRLELEITETVLLEDTEEALCTLQQLHDLGVRISLDDFGTGYSSLSCLQRFAFDNIKIDASFISQLGQDADDIGIVHAVVSLANRLGVATTAEGVETEHQLDIIRAEGCTEMQGYLFSPPLPASELVARFFTSASSSENRQSA